MSTPAPPTSSLALTGLPTGDVAEVAAAAVAAALRPPALQLRGAHVAAGDRTILEGVDLDVVASSFVAIAGPSGAGKTTLLEVMAGLRPLTSGRLDRLDPHAPVGFVPQDDIVHRQLPLDRTLDHAARLRLPGLGPDLRRQVVGELLGLLDLSSCAGVRVRELSGGQRKRASLATELLDEPRLLFLDEPTSGLDPSSAQEVTAALHALVARGTTVIMTTHDPSHLEECDQVVLVDRHGRLAHAGPPATASGAFGVDRLRDVYPALADPDPSRAPTAPSLPPPGQPAPTVAAPAVRSARARRGGSFIHQVRVLARRSAEVMTADRLTLAVLLGSPALVIAMMAVLFPAGGFARPDQGVGATQTVFWIAFAGFFFGLTYGLLQIVGERAIVRREQVAGLRPGAYVAAKVAVLLPVLVAISAALLVVLRVLDRLPDTSASMFGLLLLTLVLESLASLLVGLAASALVRDAAQATLALPMLCFPQVLFAGAIVPVDEMAGAGRVISLFMATRWSFESLGRVLEVHDPRAGDAFVGAPSTGWIVLLVMAAVGAVVTVVALRARPAAR